MSENLDDALKQQQQQQHKQKQYYINNLNIILKMQQVSVDYYKSFFIKINFKDNFKNFCQYIKLKCFTFCHSTIH